MTAFDAWRKAALPDDLGAFEDERLIVWHCLSRDHRFVGRVLRTISRHAPLRAALAEGRFRGVIFHLAEHVGASVPAPPPAPAGVSYVPVRYTQELRRLTPGHDVTARACKITAPLLWPRARASLCLDADLAINADARLLADALDYAERFGFIVTRHPKAWWQEPLTPEQKVDYEGRPGMHRLVPLYICGAVARGHRTALCHGLTEAWVREFFRRPTREQPTLSAAVQASGLAPLASAQTLLSLGTPKHWGVSAVFTHDPKGRFMTHAQPRSPRDILRERASSPSDINEHLRTIHGTVLDAKAQVAVELGVRGGESTVALLCALDETGGRLYSCDVRDWPATRGKVKGYGLDTRWSFVVADDLVWGKGWDRPIDVLFVDSSHERGHTEAELRLFAPHVRPGGVILLHDTVSFREGVEGAVHAFMADNGGWTYENHENNNGLGILRRAAAESRGRGTDRVCRFSFTPVSGLDTTSGASVAVAALSEALRGDARFRPPAVGALGAEDIRWYPGASTGLIGALDLDAFHGRIAIGPQVLFANSQAPGAGAHERALMDYGGYAAIFTFSRWYQELLKLNMRQRTRHVLLDYPLPAAWLGEEWTREVVTDVLIYVKGGAEEQRIATALREAFPSSRVLPYGGFTRAELFEAARTSRACFYISREDHYPLAAVEIGLMGCPIISDEKACPVLVHRLTGIAAPVRERDTRAPFAWAPDAAERLAAEFRAACLLDRGETRLTVVRRHDPALCVERIAAALGLNRD